MSRRSLPARAMALISLSAIAALAPTPSWAHLVNTRFGNFYDGMLHPLTALEHMVPWLALGLLAGLQPKSGRWILLAFPIGLVVGLGLATQWPAVQFVDAANVGSMIVLGALIALAFPAPPIVLGILACAIGVSHGYANGEAMNADTNAFLFIPGVITVGYIVVLIVAAFAAVCSHKWAAGKIAVRALGSWIFAVGIMMLGATTFMKV